MTDDFDALEAELRGLSPCPPSPGLRRRIAGRLADAAPAPRPVGRYAALAGLLAAAVLAFAVLRGRTDHRITAPEVAVRPAPPAAGPPTLQAYRRALAQSPDALTALLDAEALRTASAAPPLRAFAPNLLSSRGFPE